MAMKTKITTGIIAAALVLGAATVLASYMSQQAQAANGVSDTRNKGQQGDVASEGKRQGHGGDKGNNQAFYCGTFVSPLNPDVHSTLCYTTLEECQSAIGTGPDVISECQRYKTPPSGAFCVPAGGGLPVPC